MNNKPIAIVKGTVLDNYLEFNVFFDGYDTFILENDNVTIQLTIQQMAEKVLSFVTPVLCGRDELLKIISERCCIPTNVSDNEKHSELYKKLDKLSKERIENFFEKTDGR